MVFCVALEGSMGGWLVGGVFGGGAANRMDSGLVVVTVSSLSGRTGRRMREVRFCATW